MMSKTKTTKTLPFKLLAVGISILSLHFRPNRLILCECLSEVKKTHSMVPLHSSVSANRRDWISRVMVGAVGFTIANDSGQRPANADASTAALDSESTVPWTGTHLQLKSLGEAVTPDSQLQYWSMGRWPDPILRHPAETVEEKWFNTPTLRQAVTLLKRTADRNGAVGLAAQQCGINARIVYLSPEATTLSTRTRKRSNTLSQDGVILVNPYITERSSEADMRVWVEGCLVLPPSFRATVLRDDWIDVQYHDVEGRIHTQRFLGEASRCLQHEMDHDRGILLTDHVGLEELPLRMQEWKEGPNMMEIEAPGHRQRMEEAYDRYIDAPTTASRPRNKYLESDLRVQGTKRVATAVQFGILLPLIPLNSRLASKLHVHGNTSPTPDDLRAQLSYIEALEERNKAQLDSFLDEQDQWDSLEPFEQELLLQKESILR
ncbi:peptide deformylase [Nitzschia inconspicua]|uniref:Peptide deformylase n=1 Tax=Nitzschia inconspicua TaxID=303405 RepID=A0A9K3KC49_9STRA|nr:peptide deformylase [Nitzschia inconspicua]KAG7340441.1 peptide deformylase [Nitzschia inconspicua]